MIRRVGLALLAVVGCGRSPVTSLGDAGIEPIPSCLEVGTFCDGNTLSCCAGARCKREHFGQQCARDAKPVGAACSSDSDCTFLCLTRPPFTGGYCSMAVTECAAGTRPDGLDPVCPEGSACALAGFMLPNGASDFCVARCSADDDCRVAEGYRCCPESKTCLPTARCP